MDILFLIQNDSEVLVARHGAILTIRQVDEHLQNVVFVDIVETFPFPRQFSQKVQKFREQIITNLVTNFAFLCKT